MCISSSTKIRNRRERNNEKSLIIIVNILTCELNCAVTGGSVHYYFALFSATTKNNLLVFLR